MCWLYVPGLAASNLESALPNAARAAFVTSKVKPMRPQSLRRAWKMGGCIRRLSGLILEPSILAHGAESWIASLRAIRANPTALPGSGLAPMTIDGCSTMSCGLLKPSGLIVSSAKTYRGMPMGSSPPSYPHWKAWATALRREYSARPNSAPARRAKGCSFWQTPTTRDAKGQSGAGNRIKRGRNGRLHVANLCDQLWDCGRLDLIRSATFREWLMTLPIGWTACAPLETRSIHWLPHMRGLLWTLCLPPKPEMPDLFGFAVRPD